MACTITDTARGRQLIGTSVRRTRGRRIATVPGIITTAEEAKKLQTPSTSAQPGKISSRWCNISSSKYLARCGGGSISASKQIKSVLMHFLWFQRAIHEMGSNSQNPQEKHNLKILYHL